MSTSQLVFALRKAGNTDEAYAMAAKLVAMPKPDDWAWKAFAYCVIDLVKRDVAEGNRALLDQYCTELNLVRIDVPDEILNKSIRNAISLCQPHGPLILRAKAHSKDGRHEQAVELYRQVWEAGSADIDICTQFGWELYRLSKKLLEISNANFPRIKQNLHVYLKLNVEKPSLLHSCVLQLALKLANAGKLKLVPFCRLWNLELMRAEDYASFVSDDGKQLPSLVEKVIQSIGKEASASGVHEDIAYVLPHINAAVDKFPNNIWLQMNKAKMLLGLGRHVDALAFALAVARTKAEDYWAWALLGDVCAATDPDTAASCYCKALLCKPDEIYVGKIRGKLAAYMVSEGMYAEAKHELQLVLASREAEGYKVPDLVAELSAQPWFAAAQENSSNLNYYRRSTERAETLLFDHLPWLDANLGESFSLPETPPKLRRQLYVRMAGRPIEGSVSESKFRLQDLVPGTALRVKGELGDNNRLRLYLVEPRACSTAWDVFTSQVGVIDQINRDKGVFHFIVDRTLTGMGQVSDLLPSAREGDAIAVKASSRITARGIVWRAIDVQQTDEEPSGATPCVKLL